LQPEHRSILKKSATKDYMEGYTPQRPTTDRGTLLDNNMSGQKSPVSTQKVLQQER